MSLHIKEQDEREKKWERNCWERTGGEKVWSRYVKSLYNYPCQSMRVILAQKKEDSIRLCVDYRQLNKKIIRNRYPLVLVEY